MEGTSNRARRNPRGETDKASTRRKAYARFGKLRKQRKKGCPPGGECSRLRRSLVELDTRFSRVARAEADLRESERRLAETQELARLGMWEFDLEKQEIVWSDQTFRIAGLEPQPQAPSYEVYRDTIHPDDVKLLEHALQEAIELGKPYEVGLRHRRPDGSYNWTLTRARPVIVDGRVVRLHGSVLDMTEMHQTQERLQIFSSAVEQGASALILTDFDGRIEYVNPAFTSITGYQPHEVIGRVPFFLQSGKRRLEKIVEMWTTIMSGQTWQGELENKCKDGELRWVDVTIWPIKNEQGKPSRYAAILEDIHEHRRIQRELERQRSRMNYAFEASNDGIYDVNVAEMKAYLSPRFYTMLGYAPNELPPTFEMVLGLMHPEDLGNFQTTLQQVFDGDVARFDLEFRLRTKKGRWFWVRSRGKIVEHDAAGKPVRLIGTHLDINDHKRFERELEEQKLKAEAANLAKSRFLANMSHELRTPLNSILGFTRQMDRDPTFPKDHRHSLSVVNRSGEHLLDLINDVLEMSKIEVGRITTSPTTFDLHSMLDSVEQMMRERAAQKGLDLQFLMATDVPQFIEADQRKLRQVLINLVGNAVKFTAEGMVRTKVRMLERSGSTIALSFEVEDTGPGIAKQDQARVFEAFVQSDAGQSSDGTGLGLTISQRFVRLMQGELEVDSELDRGSRFHFTINAKAIAPSGAPPAPAPRRIAKLVDNHNPVDGEVYRILVVDDNEDNRLFLRLLLEDVGFDVEEAPTGQVAFERCARPGLHLVLMDLRMPGMDGYEATRRIRALPEGLGRLPVIAISASAFEEGRAHAKKAGCDDFVRKPFHESEVFEVLGRHLDVQFSFLDMRDSSVPMTPHNIRSRFAALPEELRASFETAAGLSDVGRVGQALERMRKRDAALAEALEPYVHEYAYDELLSLLNGP